MTKRCRHGEQFPLEGKSFGEGGAKRMELSREEQGRDEKIRLNHMGDREQLLMIQHFVAFSFNEQTRPVTEQDRLDSFWEQMVKGFLHHGVLDLTIHGELDDPVFILGDTRLMSTFIEERKPFPDFK